jgi:hypothetical protein
MHQSQGKFLIILEINDKERSQDFLEDEKGEDIKTIMKRILVLLGQEK